MQPRQVTIPLIEVAGFVFNVGSVIAIDRVDYLEDPNAEDRCITLHLVYDVAHEFIGARADQFNLWYLQVTGQSHVQPVSGMLPFGR
jgi:hypothetical protein